MRILILLIWFTIAIIFISAEASVISVQPPQSIQQAIESARTDDRIEISNGTYLENIHVTKRLALVGIERPVIDAGWIDNAITLSADGITIEGFNVTNSSNAGISVLSNNNIIRDNFAIGNDFCGLYLENSDNNSLISNNLINNGVIGIFLDKSSENNTIKRNKATGNGDSGIGLAESDTNYIIENSVINNGNDGIELYKCLNNFIKGNLASWNKDGICLEPGSENNTISENNASYNIIDGILIRSSQKNSVINNSISRNKEGIFLESSQKNVIASNNVSFNGDGIYLNYYSINNALFMNNLHDNSNYGAYDESGANQWYNNSIRDKIGNRQ
jgi:nitrous oxidase accessory protein